VREGQTVAGLTGKLYGCLNMQVGLGNVEMNLDLTGKAFEG
jgi:hypothetical protein